MDRGRYSYFHLGLYILSIMQCKEIEKRTMKPTLLQEIFKKFNCQLSCMKLPHNELKSNSKLWSRMAQQNAVQQTPFWYNFLLICLKPLYRWKIKQRAESDALFQQECLERFGPFQPLKI
jgi:hypothetical protein